MKIGIASDHNGYLLKDEIKSNIKDYEIIDCGNEIYNPDDDFPVYAFRLSEKVAKGEVDFGVAICGTGIGVAIACNKVKGIRCAKVDNINDVIMSKKHNNANIISFGSNTTTIDAIKYINTFIETNYINQDRYQRRNDMIINYENGEYNEL